MVEKAPGDAADELVLRDPFEITSVCSVAPPQGLPEAEWHRYEISQGHNKIVGYRAGSADTVREAVELIVLRLNMRRRNRRGRVHVVLHPKASQRSP
jgi:hypothetical protein